jgi:regulatory protein
MKRSHSNAKLSTQDLIVKLEAYCAYQERCFSEIKSKLVSLGAEENQCKLIIDHLSKTNFFNQKRFVEAFVIGKLRSNKWGRIKIKSALIQKQIEKELINQSLYSFIDSDEYNETLKYLFERKSNELANESDKWKKKEKIVRFLSSKGFEYDLIMDLFEY